MMRAFIAIDPPLNIKQTLASAQDILKRCEVRAKWVNSVNLHMTLKFLSSVSSEQIADITEMITATAGQFSCLRLTLKKFGILPNLRRPRVFFISTDKEDRLNSISQSLEQRLSGLGFEAENRFKSHITLCRFKGPKNIETMKKVADNISLGDDFEVEEICLFKSTLTATGPIYERIFSADLRK